MSIVSDYVCLWDESRQGSACGHPGEVRRTSDPSEVTCQSCNLLNWHLTSEWKVRGKLTVGR